MNGMGWMGRASALCVLMLVGLLAAACGGGDEPVVQDQQEALAQQATAQAAPIIAQATAEAQLDPMLPAEALAAALTARDAAAAEEYAPGRASVLLNRMANQESAHAGTIQSITVEPGPPNERNVVWFFYHLDNGLTVREMVSYTWEEGDRWQYSGSGDPEVGLLQPDGSIAQPPTPEPTPVPDVTPILQRMADAISRGEYTAIEDLVDDPETVFGNYRAEQERRASHGAFLGSVTVAPFTSMDRSRYGGVGGFLVWEFEKAFVSQPILVDQTGGGMNITVRTNAVHQFKDR